ncbi:trichohyalin isoform X1, partial [Tachysurus ichikawai]
ETSNLRSALKAVINARDVFCALSFLYFICRCERKDRVDEQLSKINHIQSRLRSNMRSVTLLNQQLSSMSEENKRNKKLLEMEQKRRSHLEQFLGLSVNQSSVPLFSPPSLRPSDLELDQMETQPLQRDSSYVGLYERQKESIVLITSLQKVAE